MIRSCWIATALNHPHHSAQICSIFTARVQKGTFHSLWSDTAMPRFHRVQLIERLKLSVDLSLLLALSRRFVTCFIRQGLRADRCRVVYRRAVQHRRGCRADVCRLLRIHCGALHVIKWGHDRGGLTTDSRVSSICLGHFVVIASAVCDIPTLTLSHAIRA